MFWWGLLVVGLIGQPDNSARHLVRLPARCECDRCILPAIMPLQSIACEYTCVQWWRCSKA